MSGFGYHLGIKTAKGVVSVEKFRERIRLRWRFQERRYSLSLSVYNELNLLKAKQVALQIEQDIVVGSFDQTLKKYAPHRSDTHKQSAKAADFVILFENWVKNYKQMDCDLYTNYHSTRSMIRKWGNTTPVNILSKLNAETFCDVTYNRRLTILKSFVKWLIIEGFWERNPLEHVQHKKVKRRALPKREPFKEEEIRQILEAIRTNQFCSPYVVFKHSHYYPFMYFLFKTGVRNAEAVGLRVSAIDLKENLIHIREVLARSLQSASSTSRTRKGTKNGKDRVIPLTKDLHALLLPLLEGKSPDALVFTSPTGVAIDDHNFQNRVFKKVLKGLNIPERVLYAARHTFGSRCIDQGLTPVMTAFLMGNNPETALRRYTHQMSLPTELPDV
jgi:integrase